MLDYTAFNKSVFDKIPTSAQSILDVGCGTGNMGKALKDQNNQRIIHGITYSKTEYAVSAELLEKVWIADINTEIPDINIKYDCIIFSHILEHTFKPGEVLKSFINFLKDDGVVIIALPNVLQYKQRLEFLKGNFRYSAAGGLMDNTHFRFFDWATAQEMITNASLKIIAKEASGHFPLFFLRKLAPAFSRSMDGFAVKHWPGLFAFQFIFIAANK